MSAERVFLRGGRQVHLSEPMIGQGAEGYVLSVKDQPRICAKLYIEPTDLHRTRIEALVELPPADWSGDCAEHVHVAWPQAGLYDEEGKLVGFLMSRVAGIALDNLFDHDTPQNHGLDDPSWRNRMVIASRVARLFAMLHERQIVLGDIKPANLVVDQHGHVTLLDCDSVQFVDRRTGDVHKPTKFTPIYAPPELLSTQHALLSGHHDTFGLAVLICRLLLGGDHPFEGVPTLGGGDTLEENIRRNANRVTQPRSLVELTQLPPPTLLPPPVYALLKKAFDDGRADPAHRPAAKTWQEVLHQAAGELTECRINSWHAYPPAAAACGWCAFVKQHGGPYYVGGPPPPPPPPVRVPVTSPVPDRGLLANSPPRSGPVPVQVYSPQPVPTTPVAPSSPKRKVPVGAVVVFAVLAVLAAVICVGVLSRAA
ncbi:hypothetical protein CS0771_41330 [Catellatospora sp. IY07-71]|uniref:protein kinase domain-containing protein n=1 Tax=Catellatospora sp. IY07-71 TaxID=2728827 RepID=UPI001BB3DF36|nr:protein kinase [Catellatospora sp. IY07-71]BCJ74589.1 hypothetical protein CS0771_41330 [Catellatospora sp. IY07-71]